MLLVDIFKKYYKNKIFLYILIFILCLVCTCNINNYDYDLYARLIVGEGFVEKGIINYEDFLSYTPTHFWYDHEWGSGVVFYLFYKLFGAIGFIILYTACLFTTTVFIMKTQAIQKKAYPLSIFFITIFIATFNHLNPSLIRCQLFSFMFFAIYLYLLESFRLKKTNLIWLILPLTIIWNNLHGGIISGLGIVFLYFIGEALSKKACLKYLYVLLASTLALVINPYGIKYLHFLISANTMNRTYVTEWMHVFVTRHILYYAPTFIGCTIFAILQTFNLIKNRQNSLTKYLLLGATLFLGTIHVKLLSLTIIVIFSLFYNEIGQLFKKIFIKRVNIVTSIIILLLSLSVFKTNPTFARADWKKFPVKEVEFIKINNIKGNILCSFGYGSYVSYKLYPQNLIYMDGRYEEVYNDEEFENLKHFETNDKYWNNVFTKYPTTIVVAENGSIPMQMLDALNNWIKVYNGNNAGVYLRKQDLKNEYKLPSEDLNYYKKHEFDNMGHFGK